MSKNPEAPTRIEGKVICVDGEEIMFSLDVDYGWQQWGNTQDKLFRTVSLLDSLQGACLEYLEEEIEDDDDDTAD